MTTIKQIGGTHYGTGYGHWDYVEDVNAPYLEACATKYLTRWRGKNGTQDLRKAISYMEKRVANWHNHKGVLRGAKKNVAMFGLFLSDNNVPDAESKIIDKVLHWKNIEDLLTTAMCVHRLIEEEERREDEQLQAEIAWSKAREGC